MSLSFKEARGFCDTSTWCAGLHEKECGSQQFGFCYIMLGPLCGPSKRVKSELVSSPTSCVWLKPSRTPPPTEVASKVSRSTLDPREASPDGLKSMWLPMKGSCTVDKVGCLLSPGYPEAYRGDHCVVGVNASNAGPISVKRFNTETDYNVLTLNGDDFSGTRGPEGVIPSGLLEWRADRPAGSGLWKLCRHELAT